VLHGFGIFHGDFHQVFSPENIPLENLSHLSDYLLPDTRDTFFSAKG
jgi:hypothetical protein